MTFWKALAVLITKQWWHFVTLTVQHIEISLAAIVIVSIAGVLLGTLIYYVKSTRHITLGIVNLLYTIPSIALLGLFIPLVGIGLKNALLTLSLYGLLPVIRSTYLGFEQVPKDLQETALALGTTKKQLFFKILLPLALPSIIGGYKLMVVMVIAMTGLAAYIGVGGLGQAIFTGITTYNTPMIVLGSTLIAAVAVGADLINTYVTKILLSYKLSMRKRLAPAFVFILSLGLIIVLFHVADHSIAARKGRVVTAQSSPVILANKPQIENKILIQMVALLLKKDKIPYIVKPDISGGTLTMHPALIHGAIDIYPEYTSTAWLTVLHKKDRLSRQALYAALQKQYNKDFDVSWLLLYGFNNTYSLGVSQQTAKTYKLKTFSDLIPYSSKLTLGAEFDFFSREDTYPRLKQVYGFNFKTRPLDINLRYKALENKLIDVTSVFTTDPSIIENHIVVLNDDKKVFPRYDAGLVARNDVLTRYPGIKKDLHPLSGILTEKGMQALNLSVLTHKKSAQQAAKDYLTEKGLL